MQSGINIIIKRYRLISWTVHYTTLHICNYDFQMRTLFFTVRFLDDSFLENVFVTY